MAARKGSGGSRRPKTKNVDAHSEGPVTRDPGPTGNIGCYVLAAAGVLIGLTILVLETLV
ncbi:hypothetical protein RIF23_02735 [Lipingzhangella sp. LS1_29]|uniref:Uncharacterized protein n=1 Tax=Lipingzhangella rawalii TaxID=2055835 RepID=A0ABU2H3N3_9ACTN|nr:hypothetical protein [Lipingzhangella rawalii]MDS1269209.1 hypothetical protein [Lipingzhangella rawalii]